MTRQLWLVAAAVSMTAGCAAHDPAPSPPVTVTITASQSMTATPLTSAPQDTPSPTLSAEGPTSSGASVVSDDATGRALSLSQFFRPDEEWSESRYDIASQSQVQGLGAELTPCGSDDYRARVLELRLSNSFDSLSFSAGEANTSEVSDKPMVVEVVANNRQIDIQTVSFNEIREFVEPVTGVNALKIKIYGAAKTDCGGGTITGVVVSPTLT